LTPSTAAVVVVAVLAKAGVVEGKLSYETYNGKLEQIC